MNISAILGTKMITLLTLSTLLNAEVIKYPITLYILNLYLRLAIKELTYGKTQANLGGGDFLKSSDQGQQSRNDDAK